MSIITKTNIVISKIDIWELIENTEKGNTVCKLLQYYIWCCVVIIPIVTQARIIIRLSYNSHRNTI
jgi:hypothetical protein